MPLKWYGMFVTSISEGVYSLADIPDGGGIEATERLSGKDAEPHLDLVQPGRMSRYVMEMNSGVSVQPPVMFGLMGIEVIKNNMQFLVRIKSYGLVHKVQELPAAAMAVMSGMRQSRSHFQSSEQCSGAMSFVLVAEPSKRLAIGQTQPALCPLQCLYRRFFIDTQHHGILRRVQVKPDNVSRFLGKLGVGADAPASPPLKMDTMLPEDPPDVAGGHISQRLCYQSSSPGGITRGQRFIQ